jgi:hypothetical protein
MSMSRNKREFLKLLHQTMMGEEGTSEEQKFDPLADKRDETNIIQRQIVIDLQTRLSKLVQENGSIQDIHTLSVCICANLQIKEHIEDIF